MKLKRRTTDEQIKYWQNKYSELFAAFVDLRNAIKRSPFDISTCEECGKPFVCLPDGMAWCCDECNESEDVDPDCPSCRGTGIGQTPDAACRECRGTGLRRKAANPADAYEERKNGNA